MARHIRLVALLIPFTVACGTVPNASPNPIGDGREVGSGTVGPGTDAGADAAHLADVAVGGDAGSGVPEPLADCEVLPAWEQVDFAQWMEPALFEVSPNNGLVWSGHHDNWRSTVTRAADGEVVIASDYETNARPAVALDRAWSRRVVLGGDGRLEVATTVTGETLAVLEERPADWGNRWLAADISDDGQRVAAGGCFDDAFRVRLWEVSPSVRVLGSVDVPYTGEFCTTYDSRPEIAVVGDVVFFVPSAVAELVRWDSVTGDTITVVASGEPSDAATWPWRAEVAEIAVSPDRTTLAVTGSDGHLRLLSADDLETMVEVGDAPPNLLNENTYAPPITASPVAWSPSGSLLATLGPEGRVVLRDGATATIVAELPERAGDPDETFGIPNALARLTFSRDGRALYALHMYGHAAYTCDGAAPVPTGSGPHIEATIEGPTRLERGTTATFTATHLGQPSVHAHRFFVDGEAQGYGRFDRTEDIYFEEAGTYEVSVVVDDGSHAASAAMAVVVE